MRELIKYTLFVLSQIMICACVWYSVEVYTAQNRYNDIISQSLTSIHSDISKELQGIGIQIDELSPNSYEIAAYSGRYVEPLDDFTLSLVAYNRAHEVDENIGVIKLNGDDFHLTALPKGLVGYIIDTSHRPSEDSTFQLENYVRKQGILFYNYEKLVYPNLILIVASPPQFSSFSILAKNWHLFSFFMVFLLIVNLLYAHSIFRRNQLTERLQNRVRSLKNDLNETQSCIDQTHRYFRLTQGYFQDVIRSISELTCMLKMSKQDTNVVLTKHQEQRILGNIEKMTQTHGHSQNVSVYEDVNLYELLISAKTILFSELRNKNLILTITSNADSLLVRSELYGLTSLIVSLLYRSVSANVENGAIAVNIDSAPESGLLLEIIDKGYSDLLCGGYDKSAPLPMLSNKELQAVIRQLGKVVSREHSPYKGNHTIILIADQSEEKTFENVSDKLAIVK